MRADPQTMIQEQTSPALHAAAGSRRCEWFPANDSRQHLQEPQVVDAETLLSELRGTSDEAWLRVAEWEADQPSMVGVAHGIPYWVDRARGTGNAIVPQVAAEILRCMMRVDSLHNVQVETPPLEPQ